MAEDERMHFYGIRIFSLNLTLVDVKIFWVSTEVGGCSADTSLFTVGNE